MISNSKQTWQIGSKVKVGFLTLTVHSFISRDDLNQKFYGETDGYLLVSDKGKSYIFRPHAGLMAV